MKIPTTNQSTSIITSIIIGIFFFSLFSYISLTQLHIAYWDEYDWIGRSYFFELLLNRDFDNPAWSNNIGIDQPHLTHYYYGLFLYPHYLNSTQDQTQYKYTRYLIDHHFFQEHGSSYKTHQEQTGRFITFQSGDYGSIKELIQKYGTGFNKLWELVKIARIANAIALSASVVAIYLIYIKIFDSQFWAIASAFLYGFHYLNFTAGLFAHAEGLFMFLFNLSLLLIITQFINKHSSIITSIMCGIVIGMCSQTKLHGLMLLVILFILNIIYIPIKWHNITPHQVKRILLTTTITVITFIITFIALNPFLYFKPFSSSLKLLEYRWSYSNYLIQISNDSLPYYNNRISWILNNILSGTNSPYYSLTTTIQYVLLIIGLIYLFIKVILNKSIAYLLLLVTTMVILPTVILYLKLKWPRYLYPLIPSLTIIQILGLKYVADITIIFIRKIRKTVSPSSIE